MLVNMQGNWYFSSIFGRNCKATYGFPGGTVIKNSPANEGNVRDASLIPGLGRSPGIGNGKLLQ